MTFNKWGDVFHIFLLLIEKINLLLVCLLVNILFHQLLKADIYKNVLFFAQAYFRNVLYLLLIILLI